MSPPELVTLHLWRVPRAAVRGAAVEGRTGGRCGYPGGAVREAARHRRGRDVHAPGRDPRRWGLLASWVDRASAAAFEGSAVAARWGRLADESWRAELRPLASRGRWSGREPFGAPAGGRWDGPVAAVTRARLAPSRTRSFWRAVPPVSADLATRAGLRLAVGIGEAPVGLQGTFSLWDSAAALREFAYGSAAHQAVVARTAPARWYAEELFARFAVEAAHGSVEGRNPLA